MHVWKEKTDKPARSYRPKFRFCFAFGVDASEFFSEISSGMILTLFRNLM